jgi:glutathione peroxidase
MAVNVSEVVVRTASGAEQKLGDLNGQVLLIVNVASRCGFTRQYAGLQALQESYSPQGFSVLGFPCNDFGAQEPGTLSEIQQFCSTTYGASFPLYEKVHATAPKPPPTTCSPRPSPPGMWPGTSRSS